MSKTISRKFQNYDMSGGYQEYVYDLTATMPFSLQVTWSGVSGLTVPMPVTPTATDTGADTVTITAHGYSTGVAIRVNSSVGGLYVDTDYFVNAVDANTLKFYDTYAHAVTGGATGLIDLTDTINVELVPRNNFHVLMGNVSSSGSYFNDIINFKGLIEVASGCMMFDHTSTFNAKYLKVVYYPQNNTAGTLNDYLVIDE